MKVKYNREVAGIGTFERTFQSVRGTAYITPLVYTLCFGGLPNYIAGKITMLCGSKEKRQTFLLTQGWVAIWF